MKKIFLFVFGLLIAWPIFSINFDVITSNPSQNNNDCWARVENIKNGTPPFVFSWSEPSIGITEKYATNLHEGKEYNVTVTDSTGESLTKVIYFQPTSPGEKLNHFFGIMVDAVASVLMIDIFAALDLYDPILYNSDGSPILNPNGTPKKTNIPLIVVWLFLGALYFTFKFRFISIRGFKHAIQLIRGKFDKPNEKGEITHFQALATALSATVGLGNIAGVAFAIGIGGPGATFWMISMGLLGMSSKFAEATLGVKYRRINKKSGVSGGPMYYLKYVFGQGKIGKKLGLALSAFFAILLIGSSLGGGNMFQANQSFSNLKQMIPEISNYGMEFGILLAVLVGLVIIGEISHLAKVTSKIVPIMAGTYIITGSIIIALNFSRIGEVFALIIDGAFNAKSMYGGFIGVLVMGVQRAAFSNEAGIGSAAIAHSTVKTSKPVSEGIVALLEPFIDTVVICTFTALILLFTGYYAPEYTSKFSGAELTSEAFGSVFPWFRWILLFTVLLFAYSTLISWSYYGLKGFDYLFGNAFERKFGTRKVSDVVYKIIFLFFTVVGTTSSAGNVLDFSDMMLLCMAFPNMIGLVVFAPRIKKELDTYLKDLKSGKIKQYK